MPNPHETSSTDELASWGKRSLFTKGGEGDTRKKTAGDDTSFRWTPAARLACFLSRFIGHTALSPLRVFFLFRSGFGE